MCTRSRSRASRSSPNLWRRAADVHRTRKRSPTRIRSRRIQLGPVGADRLRERGRQAAARDPDQAGGLRSVEEISDDGLHLRAAVEQLAPVRAAGAGHQHQHHALRQQRLHHPRSRTSSTRSAIPGRARSSASCRPSKKVVDGLHRSEAHRHPGPLVGRLPDHLHDHADEHLRGGRGRRVGVEHDQRLRRHPLGHGHVSARSSTRRRRAASARRRGTRRCSSSRTRRSSGSSGSTRRT